MTAGPLFRGPIRDSKHTASSISDFALIPATVNEAKAKVTSWETDLIRRQRLAFFRTVLDRKVKMIAKYAYALPDACEEKWRFR